MYTPSNIAAPDSIHKELDEIQAFLEAQYAADVPEQVQMKFDSLASYMARSGKLKADAEWHYNSLIESSIMDALKKGYEEKLSPSTINKFVEAAARNYKFLLTWADRVNRTCTHQLEGIRSVMSTLRSERFANNYGKSS
jgi:hypothetical protein